MRLVPILIVIIFLSLANAVVAKDGIGEQVAQLPPVHSLQSPSLPLSVKAKGGRKGPGVCFVGDCCKDHPGTQQICYFSEDKCFLCFCVSSKTCGGDGDVRKHTPIRIPKSL